jgi:acetyl esterase
VLFRSDAADATIAANRRYYDAMCAIFRAPRPAGVATADERVDGVPVRVYRSIAAALPGAAVLYAHGGGFVLGSLESHDDVCAEIAAATGATVVAVDYRLAPEHRHPAQLDDVETVWRTVTRAFDRVVVAGDSAGACLVAGLCLRLRRKGDMQPAGQVLIYPGLGGDRSLAAYHDNAEAPMLRTADLGFYQVARFGGDEPAGPVDEAHPLQATDYAGLPPAFVVSADVDPLRDDGKVFAERLTEAGVAAAWRNESQLVHGYLRARHTSGRAAASFASITAAITWFLAER